jgi:hypothetical protein
VNRDVDDTGSQRRLTVDDGCHPFTVTIPLDKVGSEREVGNGRARGAVENDDPALWAAAGFLPRLDWCFGKLLT